jgi:alkylation response protein AidB-like acyl-CoA dehydrogenase
MERYWREAKLYEIGAGTNQIMRNIVVSHLQDPR